MKKLSFTFLMAMLSIFIANALPDSKRDTELSDLMENYTAINDSVIQRMNVITAKVDSVHTQMKSDAEKSWCGHDIDLSNVQIAFGGLIVGILGCVIGYLGYRASKRTADNVRRASFNVQKGQFDDLIRHLYRNLVCTLAFTQQIVKNRKQETTYQYPSEEHLLKLKVLPEDVLHLETYNNDFKIYTKMHELKLLLRNYDIEIDTALTHLKDNAQDEEMIMENLDTLTFKPLYLISRVVEVTKMLAQKECKKNFKLFKSKKVEDGHQNAASMITKSHINNIADWGYLFKGSECLDLNALLQLKETGEAEENEEDVKKPYNGLGRSYNRFFKAIIDANKKASGNQENENSAKPTDSTEDKPKDYVEYGKRFDNEKKYTDYSNAIEGICGTDKADPNGMSFTGRLNNFKDDITGNQNLPFKKNFLTMLSIDVTIELHKIHMIDTK